MPVLDERFGLVVYPLKAGAAWLGWERPFPFGPCLGLLGRRTHQPHAAYARTAFPLMRHRSLLCAMAGPSALWHGNSPLAITLSAALPVGRSRAGTRDVTCFAGRKPRCSGGSVRDRQRQMAQEQGQDQAHGQAQWQIPA